MPIPSSVNLHKIPNWLRLLWIRNRPLDLPRKYGNSSCLILMEIGEWLTKRVNYHNVLDHCGTTIINGNDYFANEPYDSLEAALDRLRPLAEHLNLRLTGHHEAEWGRAELPPSRRPVRVLLHPPAHYNLGYQ
jgi:hypothetical protein